MESKQVSFLIAELNSHTIIPKDLRLTIPKSIAVSINLQRANSGQVDYIGNMNVGSNVRGQDTIYRRPTSMMLVNQTGADYEFNLISDDTELVNYSGYPQNYNKIKVKNGSTLSITPIPKSSYMLGYTSGTVSSNLDIYFWGYV